MPHRIAVIAVVLAFTATGCAQKLRLRSADTETPPFISIAAADSTPVLAVSPVETHLTALSDWDEYEPLNTIDLEVSGFWVPAFKVNPDEDERERNQGIEFDADLDTGSGWAARIGVGGDHRGQGLGLLYMTTRHREDLTRRHARTHSGYLEYLMRTPHSRGPLDATFAAGIGVGGAAFDFDGGFDDTGGGAVMLRGEVGLRLFHQIDLTVGGGGFLWGYPGETIGYGGFFTVGGSVRF